jgi:hypothetical protein
MDEIARLQDPDARRLEAHDVTAWTAFLPTIRMGGALPVTFRIDDDHVAVEMIVPFVSPAPQPPAERDGEALARSYPTKIPLGIAEGFPIPVSARFPLPPYVADEAMHFIRHIVREIYHHEIDEQLRIGDRRPFAPHGQS